jgi:hypothetical protein
MSFTIFLLFLTLIASGLEYYLVHYTTKNQLTLEQQIRILAGKSLLMWAIIILYSVWHLIKLLTDFFSSTVI